jgi:hypothetical protein
MVSYCATLERMLHWGSHLLKKATDGPLDEPGLELKAYEENGNVICRTE